MESRSYTYPANVRKKKRSKRLAEGVGLPSQACRRRGGVRCGKMCSATRRRGCGCPRYGCRQRLNPSAGSRPSSLVSSRRRDGQPGTLGSRDQGGFAVCRRACVQDQISVPIQASRWLRACFLARPCGLSASLQNQPPSLDVALGMLGYAQCLPGDKFWASAEDRLGVRGDKAKTLYQP